MFGLYIDAVRSCRSLGPLAYLQQKSFTTDRLMLCVDAAHSGSVASGRSSCKSKLNTCQV